MIVHIETGASFKGAGLYLLHDKRESGETERYTADRIPWTYALNTLEDDPQHVIAEMQQTCLDQAALKLESGNRPDGRPMAKPVMTVSLAWSPYQKQPTPEGMIAAAKDYLKDRGWDELQVLMVPHTDEDHAHIHLLINRVHPETGMAADQSYRNHNAVLWSQAYDAAEGFFLDRREAKYSRGETIGKDMTRAEWEAWKAAGGTVRPGGVEQAAEQKSGEWDALKAAQRDERKAFYKETAALRADLRDTVRDTVKDEFADAWTDYAAQRDVQQLQQKQRDQETRRAIRHLRQHSHGLSGAGVMRLEARRGEQYAAMRAELSELRAPIIAAQTARVKELAAPALVQLDKERADAYEALKASHRDEKKELHADQAAGTPRPDLLQRQQDAAAKLTEASQPRPVPVLVPDASQRPTGASHHHSHGASPSPAPDAPRSEPKPNRFARGASRPRADTQPVIEAARAYEAQKSAERESGGDDGGRGLDR